MNIDKVRKILSHGEDYNIEFKQCKNEVSHSVYETVCSFLEHSGGVYTTRIIKLISRITGSLN